MTDVAPNRKLMAVAIDSQERNQAVRMVSEYLESLYGKENVWESEEMQRDFEVVGFAFPFFWVQRKSDGVRGTLAYVRTPRLYYDFKPLDGKIC